MSNKSFVIQYIIKARDQYSRVAGNIELGSKKIRASVRKASQSFVEFSKKTRTAGLVMTAAITTPVLLAARSLKNAARDAGETESKFNTVFRNVSNNANKSARDLAKNYGLSRTESRKLLSDTGDLLTGFGMTQDKALELSTEVNKLAVDLASFTNYSGGASGASEALTKALLGERESLKSLGIVVSEEGVKKKIAQMISAGATFQTLQEAKARATLAIAMEQSKNAIGDFARTQDQLANQERFTDAAIKNMKESFGKLLLPAALKLTQAIGGLVRCLDNLSPGAKKVILGFAAFAAVIGPVLLAVAALGAAIPLVTAGFAAMGTVAAFAFGPIGLAIMAITAAAALIIANWETVKGWFASFWEWIQGIFSSLVGVLLAPFKQIMAMKDMVASFLGFGEDKKIESTQKKITEATMNSRSKVDVSMRVGLDKGLKQTAEPVIETMGARRADVGLAGA